jgi:RNA polymerase sigma-70 factor, ECF subfamily
VNASILRMIGDAARGAPESVATAPMTIEVLFSTYAPFVWRTLRHFGVARCDLDDQTQEVFIIAHRRLSEWDGEQPRAWLYAIARRCAAGYRRRSHRRHERAVEAMPESSDGRDPAARIEMDRLNRALDALDEDKRSVFVLYEVEEMTMREVAEAVQCTLPTAYARLYAARRELARALQEVT